MEIALTALGGITLAYLFVVVRQWQSTRNLVLDDENDDPIVPVNLIDNDSAVVVAEGRGKLVYMNNRAREWFGMNGNEPNLSILARIVQPSDTIHDIFGHEGRVAFRVGQRQVEATSHLIPGEGERRMVVVMREMTAQHHEGNGFDPVQAMSMVGEVSAMLAQSFDLDYALKLIMDSIQSVIAFDASEINHWEADQSLLRPLVQTGNEHYVAAFSEEGGVYRLDEGFSGWLARYRQPLLVGDLSTRQDIKTRISSDTFQSLVGVPLMAGERFVGTLELASNQKNAFGYNDLALLQSLSSQVAVAIENTRLYRDQTNRLTELSGLQRIAQAMGYLTEPAEMYAQLASSVAELMGADIAGVLLLNEDDVLVGQGPFHGLQDGLVPHFRVSVGEGKSGYHIWHDHEWWYTNSANNDPMIENLNLQTVVELSSIRALCLMPMLVGKLRMGAVAVGNLGAGVGFSDDDMHSLGVFASEVAIVVENARLYKQERRRAEELEGLQQIAEVMGVLRDPQELHEQITSRIAQLLNVQICGIFFYDEVHNSMTLHNELYGADVADLLPYRIPILDGRLVGKIWSEREQPFSNDLPGELNEGSQLAKLTRRLNITKASFALLKVGGQPIGTLMIASKINNADFAEEDLDVLNIFAGQAAMLIDNARLYAETHQRAIEADNLRQIAEQLTSAVAFENVIGDVLQEVTILLGCEVTALGLLDAELGNLVYEPQHVYGRKMTAPVEMNIYSPGFAHSVALSRRDFTSNNMANDDEVLEPYANMAEAAGLHNTAIVPLVIQNRSIGELAAFNRRGSDFGENDLPILHAVAAQISAAIERSRLYQATDADLHARVEELNAIDRIGQQLAENLEVDHILDITRNEVSRGISADGVSIVLLAPTTEWLDDKSPVVDNRRGGLKTFGKQLTPIEVQAVVNGTPVVVADYDGPELKATADDARAAVIEPLASNDEILGLIHVYKSAPDAFTQPERDFLQRVARQTALALMNARRYGDQVRLNQVLRGRVDQINTVYSLNDLVRRGESLSQVMGEFARALAEGVGFRKVTVYLLDEASDRLNMLSQFGLTQIELGHAQQVSYTLAEAARLLQKRWQISDDAYLLPAEFKDEWSKNGRARRRTAGDVGRTWNKDDLILVPVRNAQDTLLGWISVAAPDDGQRPSTEIAESLELFAGEAAFTIENYRVMQAIREEAASTRAERNRLTLLQSMAGDIQRDTDMPTRLQAVVDGIQAAGWQKVRITMRDENLDSTLLTHAGYTEEEAIRLNAAVLPGSVWRTRFADPALKALRLGAAYYLRYDEPWVRENILFGEDPSPLSVPEDEWHPQDLVYLPLFSQSQDRVIGIIGMETPTDNARPTEESLQPVELFARQAAAAIENTRLYLDSLRQQETEQRLTDMMESVAASLDMTSVIRTLAEGLQQMVAFTRMHVGLPAEANSEFTLSRVEVTADGMVHLFDDQPVPLENSAMAKCFASNERLLVKLASEADAAEFPDLQRWYNQGERITMMVPMIAGGETMGVLRIGSEQEDAFGFEEHEDLVRRMANLSAVSINHSRLLNSLRASTSYNEAVVESIQQGIIVLDTAHQVTTVNAFIKQRYGWSDEAIGKSLYEYEPEFEVFLKHSISTALEEGTPQHQFEVQDFDKDGNRMIRNFYTYPLQQGDLVTGVVLLVEDVTERAMLESNLAQRAEQLGALTRVSTQITSTLESEEVIGIVLEALADVMLYDGVTLWLREGERLRVAAARGFEDPGAASIEELIGLYVDIETSALFRDMAGEQQIINVGDTGDDVRFTASEHRVYKNWLSAPLVSQSEVVGAIALEKTQPYYYDKSHEQLLQTFANQASIAFRNAQLFEQTTLRAHELDAQTRRLELLNRVAVALAQSLDIENIFEITLRETALALDIEEAIAIKVNHENDMARVIVEYPRGDVEPDEVFQLSDNNVVGQLRNTLLPMVIDGQSPNDALANLRPTPRRDDVLCTLHVPLVVGGTLIGTMRFDAVTDPRHFTPERVELAQTLASQAAIAVQNASLFEQSVMRTHELETLFEASQATSVTLDLDEAMRRVVSQMLSALRADYSSISLWDDVENRLEVRQASSAWGESGDVIGRVYDLVDYPVREQALRQREVIGIRLDQEPHESESGVMEESGARDRLLVPLVVNDFSIGLIDLEIREQNRYFDSSDIRLARTLASQSAIAIENARLQTETRAQIEELYIINDLSTAVSSKVNVDELFPMVRDQLPVLTNADVLFVALYDKDSDELSFPVAIDNNGDDVDMKPRPLGKDEFSWVVRRKAPLLLAGSKMAEARDSFEIDPLLPDAHCLLGVPMLAGEDVVGVLLAQDNENPRAFGLNDQRILTTVASQLGVAIQNARLFRQTSEFAQDLEARVEARTSELEQEQRHVQTLYDITTEVAASLDINRVLSRAIEKVAQAIGATSAVILGIDEVSDRLYVLHAFGDLEVSDEGDRTELRQDQGLAGWVLSNRQGVVIQDVQDDDRWYSSTERDKKQRAAVAALLEVGEDSRGVLMLFADTIGAFSEDHLKLVTAAASQLANSMNNAELYSLIRDQAERLGAILRQEQVESTKNTAILDSVADGVLYANEHGTVVLFNTAAERILGLPAERVVNRPISELTGIYGGSSGPWMDSIARWMKDPAAHVEQDFVEELLELEDGRVVSVRLSPVNMGDQFLGTVSVFRDITQMVEVDRLKSEFVSTVSHELRTPMTSIKGYADLLLLGAAGDISEAQQRFLETIKQNADRLSILVNDLLEVSRIDQDRVPLRFSPVQVDDLLEGIVAHLHSKIEESGRSMTVEVDSSSELPALRADYDRIVQVLQNLADNAFNYTPEGGQIRLAAKFDAAASEIELTISDTGHGIPESIQNRIFERFFRGDEYDEMVMESPGTGLGLSIVKSLVEMHDGSIRFDSTLGQGTTFYIRIPIMGEQSTASEQSQ